MQNRYVGDIGDFGKYGLLRALTGSGNETDPGDPLRLGVVWYLYPDESHNSDGKFTDYLACSPKNHSRFRACDPPLYEALSRLVVTGSRHIGAVRHSGILPCDTAFYEQTLSYTPGTKRSERETVRAKWLAGALESTKEADLIFCDPDNAIAGKVKPWHKRGPKYVFVEDLQEFWKRGQSLVIYHHLGFGLPAMEQIKHFSERLQLELCLPSRPWSLRYHRGTARAYFIVPQERHEDILGNRLKSFLDGPWGKQPKPHFS